MEEVDADSVLGLLKILVNYGGRANIGELARTWHLTLDELYHVLNTAENLGAVKIEKNTILITRRGLDILRMKFGDLHHLVKLKVDELT